MLSILKKFIFLVFSLLFILVFVLIVNAIRKPSQQIDVDAVDVKIEDNRVATLLSKALQFETVSKNLPDETTQNAFTQFRQFIRESFPLAFSALAVESINQHSFVLTWNGQNTELKPVMFVAHYDVVEVDARTLQDWTRPPFSGDIADGFVWGRGAMDDKVALIALLASVEQLLKQNFQPTRTIIFAFGHDEEIGGTDGASAIATWLTSHGVRPQIVFDEGMPITNGIIAGAKNPIAMIGIAEKGYLNLELSVETEGGHSSAPPTHTSVGILAQAIALLEQNPAPVRMDGVISQTFDAIAPDMQFVQRVALGNRWLLESLIGKQLAEKHSTNATVRTTIAPTMFTGSQQANVLPSRATATINVRLLPGDTVLQTIERIQNTINDNRVQISIQGEPAEASSISDVNGVGYKLIEKTVREIFRDTLVAPAQMIAATDSKHYASISENIYRFRPIQVTQEDIKRFHGVNERISVDNVESMTKFYLRLLENVGRTN